MPPQPPVPAEDPEPVPPTGPGAASVFWALLPILLPGLGAPLAFGIATSRRPSPDVVIPLIAYTAVLFAFCGPAAAWGSAMPVWADFLTVSAALAATFGASGHLLAIRRRVWTRAPAPVPVPKPPPPPPASPSGNPALDHAQHLRSVARQIAENDPMLAKHMRIGRPDLSRTHADGGLVDVNHAPVEVLRDLPGFNETTARQVRERVEHVGPFHSIDEVIVEIGIAPGFEKHLREYSLLMP